jgi:hypothetical protein
MIISGVIKRLLRKLLTGYTVTQEYVCVPFELTSNPFKIFLAFGSTEWNVTDTHFFLGYKPLIFGISLMDRERIKMVDQIEDCLLYYRDDTNSCNGKKVAVFTIRKLATETFADSTLVLFEGVHVVHDLQHWLHRKTNDLLDKLKPRNANNVDLPPNLYDQVRVAYAIPRLISVIIVGHGNNINLFPTDLHGKISPSVYVGSLRHAGKATSQVEATGNICICGVDAATFNDTYKLGKNHMAELRPEKDFTLSGMRSKHFNLPLPEGAISYRELELLHSLNVGIHRIHFYKIIGEQTLDSSIPNLAHIHKLYAQWRINLKIPTTFFFR